MSTSDTVLAFIVVALTITEIAVLFFVSEFGTPRDERKDSDVQPIDLSEPAETAEDEQKGN